jgi:methionyl-tRNA synthetase
MTIHLSLQVCASLSVLMDPLLPDSCATLRRMVGLDRPVASTPDRQGNDALRWRDAKQTLLEQGGKLGAPEILFTKLTDDVIATENESLSAMNAARESKEKPYMETRPTATFDDFMKMDLRVGRVVEAEAVPKSKKLIRTVVDLGFETRQILAGVAQHYTPEELMGKQVVVVANLAPRKMMGLESQGMILMAEDREGALSMVSSESEPGSSVS